MAIGIEQNRLHRFIQNESISHLGSDSNVLRFGPVVYEPSLFWGELIQRLKYVNFGTFSPSVLPTELVINPNLKI